jgi:DNA-binding FadR family transcriptional regulator
MTETGRVSGSRPRVHGGVVRGLALRILGGAFKPGDLLPTEQTLQDEFGISRSTLREAIRVLSAKGLLAARPRLGTAVRHQDAWNRLDAEVLEWSLAIAPDLDFVRSLMEARELFEPAAAALAARRATAQDVAGIEAAYFGMRDSLPHDIAACCESDVAFQLVGTIGAALGNVFRLTTTNGGSHERTLAAHAQVLECIRLRDVAGARTAMLGLLAVAAADLAPLLNEPLGAADG